MRHITFLVVGHAKRAIERKHDEGFRLVDRWQGVCSGCIADSALRVFVGGCGPVERCGFCGSTGRHGLWLEDLFSYMAGCLRQEYDDPATGVAAWDSEEGTYWGVVPIDSDELLGELDEPLGNDDLREAFVTAFDHEWCRAEPYRPTHDERLTNSWDGFSRYVKEESRYLFLHTGRSATAAADVVEPDLVEPAAMLEELRVSIFNTGLIRRLPAGRKLFRARQHPLEKTPAAPGELGSPPRAAAGANRMSPAGIPMFYAADDPVTALAELRLESYPRRATVAAWSTARELAFLDLANVDVPSIFHMTARGQRPWRLFLHRFAGEVAEPVNSAAAGVEYVPTQIVTEFVRHELLDSDGSPVRAICYRSATRPDGVSWVLFVDGGGCVEAQPGWQDNPNHWLGLDAASIRHFEPCWAESTR
ncbi:MAG TPA: HEPN-associated N-terminal domain-containing protein [Acidimicrobiales bacterium]